LFEAFLSRIKALHQSLCFGAGMEPDPASVAPSASDLAALIRAAGPVPRYTSYPTAPHFRPVEGDRVWRDWLGAVPEGRHFALYVHVPYCRQMCWYCGCHTQVTKSSDTLERFTGLLAREIDLVAQYLPPGAKLSSLHFGGGTPGIIGADGLKRVADHLFRHFTPRPGAEIAIELDPRHADATLVAGLAAIGINRVSLGVQSLDARVQTAINRLQSFDCVERAVALLRDAGIASLNLDLLYGLPYQTVLNTIETVEQCLALAPDRLALFGYAHVPWMKAHQARIDEAALPDIQARIEQEAAAANYLAAAGFRRIGLDHFARPEDPLAVRAAAGNLHRNFQGYTTEIGEVLLGFGPSAISTLSQGYAQNIPAVASWRQAVLAGRLPVARMRELSAEDRLRGAVIEQLMCSLQVDLAAMAATAGADPHLFAAALERLVELRRRGLVAVDGWVITVPERGRPLLRQVCAAFDAYLAGPTETAPAMPPHHAAA
jgi:oxygen-independent coproporphyrinogen-3 oxidase